MVQIRHKVILKNLSYSEIIKCFAYFFKRKSSQREINMRL